jgi:hypothetical protein
LRVYLGSHAVAVLAWMGDVAVLELEGILEVVVVVVVVVRVKG